LQALYRDPLPRAPTGRGTGQTGARIAVAELDPAVTDTARRSVYLDPRGMTIVREDDRAA